MNSNLFIDNHNNNNNNNNIMNNSLFLNQETIANFLFGASGVSSTATSALPTPTGTTSSMDQWLADELHQTGLLSMMPDFLKQENEDAAACNIMLDYINTSHPSPPLTNSSPCLQQSASPVLMSSPSSSSSPSSISSEHINDHSSPTPSMNALPSSKSATTIAVATPPLFPDIAPLPNTTAATAATAAIKKPSGYRAIAPAKKQPIPIMPKTAATSTMNIQPSSSSPLSMNHPLLPSSPSAHLLSSHSSLMGHHHGSSTKRKQMDEKEQDDIALKRQKNTDAARRSRLKKLMKMESLEKRVVELETDNSKLTTRIAVLESEKSGLESKDKNLEERIRTLEAQLAEAHKALTGRQ